MYKNFIKSISLLLAVCLLFVGCKEGGNSAANNSGEENPAAPDASAYAAPFNIPENLMSEAEYRAEVDRLTAESGYADADDAYVENIDTLRTGLYNMITYDQSAAEYTGTAYYVSPNGSDRNDGKSPETAWMSLDKVNVTDLNAGDAVLFERGGLWRGKLILQSGVTYTTYGEGHKPKIYSAIDGMTFTWVESEYPNVWVTEKALNTDDVGVVVFNNGEADESYAEIEVNFSELDKNFEFLFNGLYSKESPKDRRLYIYCDKGNPTEVFNKIDISTAGSAMRFKDTPENVTLHGLEVSYGQDYFFTSNLKNINVKYCTFRWMGGQWTSGEGIRCGGGGGAWQNCDTVIFDHCYFYQHFDAGTSPQYSSNGDVSVFKNYRVTDCLIEKAEYAFEYFHSSREESLYEDFYIAYNIMYDTGGGFGDKRNRSACLKGRQYTPAVNCIVEKNIYDRSQTQSLNLAAYNVDKTYNDKNIFTMRNNVYLVARPNAKFAVINDNTYKANEADYKKYVAAGYEQNPIMRVINQK